MVDKAEFHEPMRAWPTLLPHGLLVNISTRDTDLFVYQLGQIHHPTILMIHGLGDEADTWRHVIEPLAKNYHVIALDLPGFGRSDKPKRRYNPEFLLQLILDLMDQLMIKKAILMGSSLGAVLAHGLAITHPGRVLGLILVGGALYQPYPMTDMGLRLMRVPLLGEWLYTRLRKNPDAAFNSLRNVYHRLDHLPTPDQEFLYLRVNQRVWSDGQRRAFFSTLRNLVPWVSAQQELLSEKLEHLTVPTLVIRGEHDSLFPSDNVNAIKDSQPNVETATIKETGHLPQQEAPVSFLQTIGIWLDKLEPD